MAIASIGGGAPALQNVSSPLQQQIDERRQQDRATQLAEQDRPQDAGAGGQNAGIQDASGSNLAGQPLSQVLAAGEEDQASDTGGNTGQPAQTIGRDQSLPSPFDTNRAQVLDIAV